MNVDKTQPKNEIASEFSRAHVLIVDDDAGNRLLLREVCDKLAIGIIDEAEDGLVALDIITRFKPDLVLLDIRMPNMDGFQLMQKLADDKLNEGLSILVQTSMQAEDERVRCFNLGATDVVSRPFNLNELKARIRAHLRSAISARVLFDFRNRIQAHVEITHAFLSAILPTPERTSEQVARYGLICSSVYRPHDEIGGDLWALYDLDENTLAVVLVDASAHGLAGAINALRVDCLIQEYREHLKDPGVFLNMLDAAMAKISFGQLFAGAVALTYNKMTGEVLYAGSNIPSPVMKIGGDVTPLKTRGLPLGSGMVQTVTAKTVLPSGAALVLSSDGWFDGNVDDACVALRDAPTDRAEQLAELLVPAGSPPDDLTLIALVRR